MSELLGMSTTVELRVKMTCGGCSGAVTRVLSKSADVESFTVDLATQKVVVKTNRRGARPQFPRTAHAGWRSLTPAAVVELVSKTGKETSLWQ